jgi:hypothetical protein
VWRRALWKLAVDFLVGLWLVIQGVQLLTAGRRGSAAPTWGVVLLAAGIILWLGGIVAARRLRHR